MERIPRILLSKTTSYCHYFKELSQEVQTWHIFHTNGKCSRLVFKLTSICSHTCCSTRTSAMCCRLFWYLSCSHFLTVFPRSWSPLVLYRGLWGPKICWDGLVWRHNIQWFDSIASPKRPGPTVFELKVVRVMPNVGQMSRMQHEPILDLSGQSLWCRD